MPVTDRIAEIREQLAMVPDKSISFWPEEGQQWAITNGRNTIYVDEAMFDGHWLHLACNAKNIVTFLLGEVERHLGEVERLRDWGRRARLLLIGLIDPTLPSDVTACLELIGEEQ